MRYFEIIQEDITDTPAFKRWFGASKVVDAQGRPLRMYHGSAHNTIHHFEVGFNSWGNKEWSGNHKVISFTTDPSFADNYAGVIRPDRRPTIYPVYIRALNPGDFRNPAHVEQVIQWRRKRWQEWLETARASYPHVWTPERIDQERAKEEYQYEQNIPAGAWTYWESPGLWQAMGWDGAWTREEPHHVNAKVLNFAVADGRQVKSAIGNRGSFDPESQKLTEKA